MLYSCLLAALAALLAHLAMPGLEASFLAWGAQVPFLLAICGQTAVRGALTGFLFGFILWGLSTWWFVNGLMAIAGLGVVEAVAATALNSLLSSIPYGIFGYISARYVLLERHAGAFLPAAMFSLLVYFFPVSFPGSLAHSQYNNSFALQMAGLGGTLSVLFCVNLSNILIFKATRYRDKLSAGLLIILAAAFLLNGYLAGYYSKVGPTKTLKLGLIQPNIAKSSDSINALIRETETLAKREPKMDLIVWPETPVAFSIANQRQDYEAVKELLQRIRIPLVASGFYYQPSPKPGTPLEFFNVAYLILDSSAADDPEIHFKTRLIPFGEYLPFESYFPALRELFPSVRSYVEKHEARPLRLKEGVKLGVAICLEAIYPDVVRKLAAEGANLIINPSNDSYFGDTAGLEMHAALSRFRTAEFQLPLVRVNNAGITEAYNIRGESLIKEARKFSEGSWSVEVELPESGRTYDPNHLFAVLLIITGLLKLVPRPRAREV